LEETSRFALFAPAATGENDIVITQVLFVERLSEEQPSTAIEKSDASAPEKVAALISKFA